MTLEKLNDKVGLYGSKPGSYKYAVGDKVLEVRARMSSSKPLAYFIDGKPASATAARKLLEEK